MGEQKHTLYQRGDVWQVQYYDHGKQVRVSTGCRNEADAKKFANNLLNALEEGSNPYLFKYKATFEDLEKAVVADYVKNERSSIKRIKQALNRLRDCFGGNKLSEITTKRVEDYTAGRQEKGATNGTINRELSALIKGFNLLRKNGQISSVPYIPKLREATPREGFLEHDIFLLIRELLPEYLRDLFTFAYFCGCRKGEILSLKWKSVDLKRGAVRFEPSNTKNRQARTVYLTGEWLVPFKEAKKRQVLGCDLVFHNNGKPIKDFRVAWKNACEAASVPDLLFHDLRRTAVRNMDRAGIPERVAMQISGHKTRSVFDRYNIVSERDLQEAAVKLDTHLSSL